MAKFRIGANAEIDLLTKDELDTSLTSALAEADAAQEARLRGLKRIPLPMIYGTASGGVLNMGGASTTPIATPRAGYVWSVRHLVIEGLTSGATPDVVNITQGPRTWWQLNGNQFCQTFGRGEIMLTNGQAFAYVSVGTFAATGTIVAHGYVNEAPAELAGKFFA
jgi:hypothetical protein